MFNVWYFGFSIYDLVFRVNVECVVVSDSLRQQLLGSRHGGLSQDQGSRAHEIEYGKL